MLSMVAVRVVQGFFEVRIRDDSAYGLRDWLDDMLREHDRRGGSR
ncbi:MAG: hypothetical protein WAX29_03445 [Propionibacterium sp.]|jgi:hypothetical protein|nr:hypothetical protein [Bifidobacterium tibiigranuli]